MINADARAKAQYNQEIRQAYRAWLAFLEASAVIAEADTTVLADDPFEGDSAAQERVTAAKRRRAELPAAQRELFEAVLEQMCARLQDQHDATTQQRNGTVIAADPTTIRRTALGALEQLARGQTRDDQRGLLPRGKPGAITWISLDLREVTQAAPQATDYALSGRRGHARRGMILNIAFAVLALIATPLVFMLLQPRAPAASATGQATSDGAALAPWPILAVHDPEATWTLSVTATTTRWDAACGTAAADAAASACWLQDSFRPLQLCLPATQLQTLQTLVLDAPNGLPARSFVPQTVGTPADLSVSDCAADAGSPPVWLGQLDHVRAQPALAPGEPAPDGFQVTAMTGRGQGEDPLLAADRSAITVVVSDTATRDWVALSPTLILATGETALPSDTIRDGDQVLFTYFVAAFVEPLPVLWQVSPQANQVVRYRAMIAPPPSRDTVLRTRLQLRDLVVTPSQQTMTVRFQLHNTSHVPLVLVPADLGFQTPAARIDVRADALVQPLAPDEERVVTIDLPLETGVLTLGPLRYQFTVRR